MRCNGVPVSGELSWKIQNTLVQTFHKEATTIAVMNSAGKLSAAK
jgi:hypothetical protein